MAVPPKPSSGPEPESPASRWILQYALVVVGVALLALGWYGISGTANVAQQVPFLASASLPGVALVVAGSVLIAGDRTRRSNDRAANMVAVLYGLLTEAVAGPPETDHPETGPTSGSAAGATDDSPTAPDANAPTMVRGEVVSITGSGRFHRPECALVDDRPGVEIIDRGAIDARELQPCPICEPATPTSTA